MGFLQGNEQQQQRVVYQAFKNKNTQKKKNLLTVVWKCEISFVEH